MRLVVCCSPDLNMYCGVIYCHQAPWVMLGIGAHTLWCFWAAELQGALVPGGQAAAAA